MFSACSVRYSTRGYNCPFGRKCKRHSGPPSPPGPTATDPIFGPCLIGGVYIPQKAPLTSVLSVRVREMAIQLVNAQIVSCLTKSSRSYSQSYWQFIPLRVHTESRLNRDTKVRPVTPSANNCQHPCRLRGCDCVRSCPGGRSDYFRLERDCEKRIRVKLSRTICCNAVPTKGDQLSPSSFSSPLALRMRYPELALAA